MRVVIPQIHSLEQLSSVHPHAGMWVEMDKERAAAKGASLFIPMRGCGLKYESVKIQSVVQTVHPHTGVWVEIPDYTEYTPMASFIPIRGCGLKYIHRKQSI